MLLLSPKNTWCPEWIMNVTNSLVLPFESWLYSYSPVAQDCSGDTLCLSSKTHSKCYLSLLKVWVTMKDGQLFGEMSWRSPKITLQDLAEFSLQPFPPSQDCQMTAKSQTVEISLGATKIRLPRSWMPHGMEESSLCEYLCLTKQRDMFMVVI